MSGPSWLMDSARIATKIKNASGSFELREEKLKSNPTRTCPRCNHIIDNSDVFQEWPGLPKGVKFDPSDPELLWHLLARVGDGPEKPHPFIDEFIPTLEGDEGICYTHPKKLPGVKQDGSVAHFFHQTFKAYNRGTRKRRKINDNLGDVRWHKTGKTKPIMLDGTQRGCKKILVLYMSTNKGAKPEKTNWVMHQYHLGREEDENDGEYVVSKVFYQQQIKQNDKAEEEEALLQTPNTSNRENTTATSLELVTPQPPTEKRHCSLDDERTTDMVAKDDKFEIKSVNISDDGEKHVDSDIIADGSEKHADNDIIADGENHVDNNTTVDDGEKHVDNDNHSTEDSKWWEGESQFLLDSQQLAEGIALCAEFLHSQSSCGGEEMEKNRPRLADYASLGAECLKRDLEECQKLSNIDNPEIVLDTPPDLRLSQLEFGSQDSILAWAEKIADAADN